MSEIVLIPGFAAQAKMDYWRRPPGITAGFRAFRSWIQTERAVVFRWGIGRSFSMWQAINPVLLIRLYLDERRLAQTEHQQKALSDFLMAEQPRLIVCHSMGCFLLLKTAERFGLPASVKQIVFNQADIGSGTEQGLLQTLKQPLLHVYCPWDPSLFVASFIHFSVRLGQRPVSGTAMKSQLFPLWRLWNLHTSALRDPDLVRLIDGL